MKNIIVCLFLVTTLSYASSKLTLPTLNVELQTRLSGYIVDNYQTPEDYLVEKFREHDIVFLGEYHRIKQCVEFVHGMVPVLHENGVNNIAIEFACSSDQGLIDSLISSDTFDLALAYQIQFNQWPYWGYQEYIDIYRVVWDFNRSLSDDEHQFRIVALNSKSDFRHLRSMDDIYDPVVMRKVRPAGPRDSVMANVIEKEILAKKEKGLIYCGFGHAFTKYRWPKDGPLKCSASTHEIGTVGNMVFERIGQSCITVMLHSPWLTESKGLVYPVDGILDTLMLTLKTSHRRIGFDILNTPFAALPASSSYWSQYDSSFTFGDFCDGYIYLAPLSSYSGVSVAKGFINETNRVDAIMQTGNPARRDTTQSVEDIEESIARDATIEKYFKIFR